MLSLSPDEEDRNPKEEGTSGSADTENEGGVTVPGIPENVYETYRMQVQYICKWGEKEQLLELYHEIRSLYGDTEDLRNLDSLYNHRWNILTEES